MSTDKTKAFRQKIADAFVKSLSEDPKNWKKEWMGSHIPINGGTGRRYSGINRFLLQYQMAELETSDPRFYTYRQVEQLNENSEESIHVKKGSKGFEVEFWSFWYPEEKRKVSYQEAAKLQEDGKEVKPMARYYHVFHASQIEGLPVYEKVQNLEVKESEIINNIAIAMRLQLRHDGGDRAFYSPISDSIHLPRPEDFKSEHAYIGTALHELAHATGAKHRLNRTFGQRGSEEYAREELVAEIASCFACEALNYEMSDEHFENHKAYVQSWISQIKDKPEVLMKAIKEAEKASDYLEKAVFMEQTMTMELQKKQEREPAKDICHEKEAASKLSFYVAEVSEYHDLGEYHDGLSLQEAFRIYDQIPESRMHGNKEIGFNFDDGRFQGQHILMSRGRVYDDLINDISFLRENPLVQQAISDCKSEMQKRHGRKMENQAYIADYYVVEDLQHSPLNVMRFENLSDAIKQYSGISSENMKALGIMNTELLPGSLDFIQCKDGVDCLIEDYKHEKGWQNDEVKEAVKEIAAAVEVMRENAVYQTIQSASKVKQNTDNSEIMEERDYERT